MNAAETGRCPHCNEMSGSTVALLALRQQIEGERTQLRLVQGRMLPVTIPDPDEIEPDDGEDDPDSTPMLER